MKGEILCETLRLSDFARNPGFAEGISFSRQDAKPPSKRKVREAIISIAELNF
jgi:hypothetical protein